MMINLIPKVKRVDAIQSFDAQETPLVRIHDDNGRKAVYFNPNRMDGIDGWPDEESDELLDELEKLCCLSEYEYRHKWQPHDIVIWDNRSVLHAATDDYTEPRLLHRILLKGKEPS